MKIVIQRVTRASVTVEGEELGNIGEGILALVGFGRDDEPDLRGSAVWNKMLDKLFNLRIFPDDQGKLNRSLADIGGDCMIISQFTLYANCRKGRRPSFTDACPPDIASDLFDGFLEDARATAPGKIATGRFGAEMALDFVNWGPVTIMLNSETL